MKTRRDFVRAALLVSGSAVFAEALGWSEGARRDGRSVTAQIEKLEKSSGGRLGVFCMDKETGRHWGWRAQERFPMCSTYKLLAVAAVLRRVDQSREHLEQKVSFEKQQVVAYSPVTSQHVETGMTVGALCAAAITVSDNTAANLLLVRLGGPRAVTAFARSLGDVRTRLDRNEPDVNECLPGDPRDTTTPAAMARDLDTLVLGRALSASSRTLLTRWLAEDKTGVDRIHAGLPTEWREGDKTGTGDRGTANDVAILWPPNRKPVLVAAYLTGATVGREEQDAALAGVGRVVAAML